MAEIALVTFDLDNTLWAVEPVIIRAEHIMRDYLGQVAPKFNEMFDSQQMWQLRTEVVAANPTIQHDLSATRELVLRRALSMSGYDQTSAKAHAAEAFRRFLKARHDVELFDGAQQVLAELSQQLPLAVLTNGNADVRRLDIGEYFSHFHSSASANSSKPDAQIFHAALDDAGVSPNQTVHIGDNWVDDIQGAAAVGMHTIWVNFSGAPAPEVAPASKVAPASIAEAQGQAHAPSATVRNLLEIPAALAALRT